MLAAPARARPRSPTPSRSPSPATTSCARGISGRRGDARDGRARCRWRGPAGQDASRSLPAVETGWVFGRDRRTSTPGPTPPSSSCPRAATLSQVEMAPPCVNPIEPRERLAGRPASPRADDLAVTALKAIDVEYELPPACDPDRDHGRRSSRWRRPCTAVEERAKAAGLEAMTLRAGRSGLRAVVVVRACPRPASTACRAFGAPGRAASAGWWTAAARRWCARARAHAAGGRS